MSDTGTSKLQTLLTKIVVVNGAASIAEGITFPIDFTKTQMQLSTTRIGFVPCISQFVRSNGLFSVFSGLKPSILRHWIYSPSRVLSYEALRSAIGTDTVSLPITLGLGMVTGAVGQLIASPTDLMKVRLIADGGRPASQRQYQGLVDCARQTFRASGVRGFWTGWQPNVLRATMVNAGELGVYDSAKQYFLRRHGGVDGVAVHLQSAMVSGFAAALLSTPADVIKSRVMAGRLAAPAGGAAPTIRAVARSVYAEGGVVAFYKGFFPAWGRLAPWQLAFWLSYEQLRRLVGFAGFAAPPSMKKD